MSRVILNGDHAEFELKHANTPPHERPDWPLPSFDARDWAKEFVRLHGGDEALMMGWFANALMRGYDERAASPPPAKAEDGMREALERIDRENPHVETSERWRSSWANNNSDIGDIDRATAFIARHSGEK